MLFNYNREERVKITIILNVYTG